MTAIYVTHTHTYIYNRQKEEKTNTAVYVSEAKVEEVNSFKFLGISITDNLTWFSYLNSIVESSRMAVYLQGI